MNQDEEHLRLLSIFHYVVAGLMALVSCFPIFHLAMGLFFLAAPDSVFEAGDTPPPEGFRTAFGLMFTLIPMAIILSGWACAACVMTAGRRLAQRRRYNFCLVIAAILCAFMPVGTVLGIFTIIVLVRPSVKELFEDRRFLGPKPKPL